MFQAKSDCLSLLYLFLFLTLTLGLILQACIVLATSSPAVQIFYQTAVCQSRLLHTVSVSVLEHSQILVHFYGPNIWQHWYNSHLCRMASLLLNSHYTSWTVMHVQTTSTWQQIHKSAAWDIKLCVSPSKKWLRVLECKSLLDWEMTLADTCWTAVFLYSTNPPRNSASYIRLINLISQFLHHACSLSHNMDFHVFVAVVLT